MLDLEIRDNSGIRITVGRLTDALSETEMVIFDGLVVANALPLVHVTAEVSRATGTPSRGSSRRRYARLDDPDHPQAVRE